MSFEKNIPHYIDSIKQTIRNLRSEQYSLMHDCDCEFCDYDDIEDPETYDNLEQQIKDCNLTIERLKGHAKMHNIELPE